LHKALPVEDYYHTATWDVKNQVGIEKIKTCIYRQIIFMKVEYKHKFIDFLSKRLLADLPGTNAHLQMMPEIKNLPYRKLRAKKDAKKSAVLVLLYSNGDNLNIIFTLRSKKLSNHSGQISFPGGHLDKGETPVQTALRESQEEIGLKSSDIHIIGRLSDLYVPPTNYIISPVVGYMKEKPDYYINSTEEVEEIIDLPLDRFTDESIYTVESWKYNGQELKVPLWKIHSETPLWGASSMIMMEFLTLYSEFKSQSGN
jgi:8-oxo-dGTP pyrophosphatase MutT (NUDIX family)